MLEIFASFLQNFDSFLLILWIYWTTELKFYEYEDNSYNAVILVTLKSIDQRQCIPYSKRQLQILDSHI